MWSVATQYQAVKSTLQDKGCSNQSILVDLLFQILRIFEFEKLLFHDFYENCLFCAQKLFGIDDH